MSWKRNSHRKAQDPFLFRPVVGFEIADLGDREPVCLLAVDDRALDTRGDHRRLERVADEMLGD